MHLRTLLSVSLLVLVVVGCGYTQVSARDNTPATTSTLTHLNTSTALRDFTRIITTTSTVIRTVASAVDTIATNAIEARTAATAIQLFVTLRTMEHILPNAQAPAARISVEGAPAVAVVPHQQFSEATEPLMAEHGLSSSVGSPAARISAAEAPAVAVVPHQQFSEATEPLMAEHGLSSSVGSVDAAGVAAVEMVPEAVIPVPETEALPEAAAHVAVPAAESVPVAQDVITNDAIASKPTLSMVQTSASLVEPVEPSTSLPNDPVRIVAESIGMDEPVLSVGLDEYNMPIVPNHDPGWYNLSARPGEGENIVFWGHVLRFQYAPEIPAPFGRVKELAVGAPITVYTADGLARTYRVHTQVWVEPHQIEYILPQGAEQLTLVSCIGDYIIVDGSVENMTHRLITIALPVS